MIDDSSLPPITIAPSSAPVLELNEIRKSFVRLSDNRFSGRRHVLDGVTMTVRRGDIYGFVGLNGAGKTTAIKAMLGLIHPDAGNIRLFGQPASSAALERIGFSPEKPSFYEYLNVEETLRFGIRLSGRNVPESRFVEVLELVDLAGDRKKNVGACSKGMQQRLALAAAMLHDPELLILDEPSSGLDPLGRRMIKDVLQKLKSQGKTLFFSTHILADVEEICDRVGIIHEGRMIFEGSPHEFDPSESHMEEKFVRLIASNASATSATSAPSSELGLPNS
ncbi:MAG: ABC transporter ATP-binding protein [Candidatus Ozemobacteraceae bacterium]